MNLFENLQLMKEVDEMLNISPDEFYDKLKSGEFENATHIYIPQGVTSIESFAFKRYTNLTDITIPNSVTNIGDSAFEDCEGLTKITIPNSVTNIGNSAFYGCTRLTEVTIPEGVTRIGYGTFRNCYRLVNVTIPDGVTRIGYNAFWGCSNLTDITIPNSVTSIGDSAFYGCTNLKFISYEGKKFSLEDFENYIDSKQEIIKNDTNDNITDNESNEEAGGVSYIDNPNLPSPPLLKKLKEIQQLNVDEFIVDDEEAEVCLSLKNDSKYKLYFYCSSQSQAGYNNIINTVIKYSNLSNFDKFFKILSVYCNNHEHTDMHVIYDMTGSEWEITMSNSPVKMTISHEYTWGDKITIGKDAVICKQIKQRCEYENFDVYKDDEFCFDNDWYVIKADDDSADYSALADLLNSF